MPQSMDSLPNGAISVRSRGVHGQRGLHWTGLPPHAVRVALVALVGVLALDVSGQLIIVVARSWDALVQGQILDAWDLVKGAAICFLLWKAARAARSWNLAAFGLLFLLIGFGDQIRIHSWAGQLLGRLLQSGGQVERQVALQIGQALALVLMATAGGALVWSWRQPALLSLRRSRTILSTLLVLMFLLAAVLNFVGSMMTSAWLSIAEEVGERLVLSAAVAYACGLAAVREWWTLP